MIKESFTPQKRSLKKIEYHVDLVIGGGGISGVCAAITAAREGIKVALIQDRPVLGGNASSEVRLWMLGATSHMGNNNRWAREGGVIDEIMVENLYRNKEGNPIILDTILLEKVRNEENISLLLNTQITDLQKSSENEIRSVSAFCSQNSTEYHFFAPLFIDATGDGILGFLAGGSFRMGAETPDEFNEGFAPDVEDYGELLGHSIYFYTKDTGRPVKFVPPAYALKNAGELPRLRNYQLQDQGSRLWWVEYGGRLDTIHQSEDIKWELWKVIYGIWDYAKNSGKFPEAENLTLEWVGTIPGKRESRRFEGDYMLKQQDVVEQIRHDDAVAFGGWALDLHPADGVYSEKRGCNQWHSKGIYSIPYRCLYSKNIRNLFLAGRIISASHVAFGSSRVMATCAHAAQAVGMAAAICMEKRIPPKDLYLNNHIPELQQRLNLAGQSVPGVPLKLKNDQVQKATITASSQLRLAELPFDGPWLSLQDGAAQLLPLETGKAYTFRLLVKAGKDTIITCSIKGSEKPENYVPEIVWQSVQLRIKKGEQWIEIPFKGLADITRYAFLLFDRNEHAFIRCSNQRITGLVSVFNIGNKAVSNSGKQEPPEGTGIHTFEFWTPKRRPEGHNLAMKIDPPLEAFSANNTANGFIRPYISANAWIPAPHDPEPSIHFQWDTPQTLHEVCLYFDTDYDHAMESSLMGHPEDIIPFCISQYKLLDDGGKIIFEKEDNHQTINRIQFNKPIITKKISLMITPTRKPFWGGLFGVVIR